LTVLCACRDQAAAFGGIDFWRAAKFAAPDGTVSVGSNDKEPYAINGKPSAGGGQVVCQPWKISGRGRT